MQIVIDISKDRYDEIMSMDWKNCRLLFDEEIRAIHDGKALEQESCEDCISREETLEALMDEWTEYDRELIGLLYDKIDKLPSVTPQPKMGRWNFTKHYGRDYYVCSFCGMERMDDHSSGWNYCPNCGAKMSEIPTVAEGSE